MAHPGQSTDAAFQLREKFGLLRAVRVTERGEGNLRRKDLFRIETGIDISEPNETFEEQSGGGKKDESERDLADDERVAQAIVTPTGGGPASPFLERFGQIGFAAGQSRDQAEGDPRPDRGGAG